MVVVFSTHLSETQGPMKIYGNFEGAYSFGNRTLRANMLVILSLFRAYLSLADIRKQALAKWYARTYFLFPQSLLMSISASYASPFFHMPYNAANILLATVSLAL